MQQVLLRDTLDWRLQNACPACTYKLEDKEKLKFSMLYTINGNNSLKRIVQHEAVPKTRENTSNLNIPIVRDKTVQIFFEFRQLLE